MVRRASIGIDLGIALVSALAIPPSVEAAGLQAVFGLSVTAGRNLNLTKNPVTNASEITGAGGTISNGQVKLGSGTYTGWDWTGYQVMVDGGTKVVNFVGCRFANQNYRNGLYAAYSQILLAIGTIASTQGTNENVTCTNCEFDGEGCQPYGVNTGGTMESAVKAYGDIAMVNCWSHNTPKDHVTILCDVWSFVNCHFQCPGKIGSGGTYIAPPADPQHVDGFHIYRGTGSFTNCFFDNYDGIATGLRGSWTSSWFFAQALSGANISITMDGCIQRGGAEIIGDGGTLSGATYTYVGAAAVGCTLAITITNSVLDKGAGGKYSSVADAQTTLTSNNNLNYSTGAAATLPGGP